MQLQMYSLILLKCFVLRRNEDTGSDDDHIHTSGGTGAKTSNIYLWASSRTAINIHFLSTASG